MPVRDIINISREKYRCYPLKQGFLRALFNFLWLSLITFLTTNHVSQVSISVLSHTRTRLKVLGLAYNRRETRDKRPLARYSDISWCHLHTSVKLFWSQPKDPWSATKKALH